MFGDKPNTDATAASTNTFGAAPSAAPSLFSKPAENSTFGGFGNKEKDATEPPKSMFGTKSDGATNAFAAPATDKPMFGAPAPTQAEKPAMFGHAQMHELWIQLSSVWRMSQPLGLNSIDREGPFTGMLPLAHSEQEVEERRRTIWAVYILDRILSACVPWSMNINDDDFCVNFPAAEEVFQSESMKVCCLPPLAVELS